MTLALSLTGLSGLVTPVSTGPTRYTNVIYSRSAEYSSHPDQAPTYLNLNDENSTTGCTTQYGFEAWVMADLGSDVPISKIRVGGGTINGGGWGAVAQYLNGRTIQTATNAAPTVWQDRGTVSGTSDTAESEFVDFALTSVVARYVRIFIAFNYVSTTEFSIFS